MQIIPIDQERMGRRVTSPADCIGCSQWRPCSRCSYEKVAPVQQGDTAPCQIMKVDFVQLHLPDNVNRLEVRLPSHYLVTRDNKEKEKIRSRYLFFDDETLERAMKDIDAMYPTMVSYKLMRDTIAEKFLFKVKSWDGKYIPKEHIKEFERRVADFKKMLGAMGTNIREVLMRYRDATIRRLFNQLMPQWEKINRWWKYGLIEGSDPFQVFKDEMTGEVDKVIKAFVPSIKYPYFDLPLSLRQDPDFRQPAKRTFAKYLSEHGRDLNWLLGTPGFTDKEEGVYWFD